MAKIRITVLRRELYLDIVKAYWGPRKQGRELPQCTILEDGQVFEVEDPPFACPEGFCDWAWADLLGDFEMLLFGPPDYWEDQPMLLCCTDGFRPVIFKAEHVFEDERPRGDS